MADLKQSGLGIKVERVFLPATKAKSISPGSRVISFMVDDHDRW